MTEGRTACLTLDLEDDWYLDEPGYDHLTLDYLEEFIELVDGLDVPLTIFVVGRTVERFPEHVDRLDDALDVEWHLHSYQHDTSKDYDFREEIQQGKAAFREHFGHDPLGYRAPQGNIEPSEFLVLEEEGFAFDSSIFPSFRPGVYSNLDAPLSPYVPDPVDEMLEVPVGALPWLRVPVAQSYLKLLGRPYEWYLGRGPLPDPLVFNVHLQDLFRTDSYDQLSSTKRFLFERNVERSTDVLRGAVETFRERGYEFTTLSEVVEAHRSIDRLADDRSGVADNYDDEADGSDGEGANDGSEEAIRA